MVKNDIKLFIAFPPSSRDAVETDNMAINIQNRFNACFTSLGYQSDCGDTLHYKDNCFDDMSKAIELIKWADVVIITSELRNKKGDWLFEMILDSGVSYLFEGQLDTIIHCYNVVEDCFNRIKE